MVRGGQNKNYRELQWQTDTKKNSVHATSLFAQRTEVNRRRKQNKGPVHRISVIRGAIGFRLLCPQTCLTIYLFLLYFEASTIK